jgi:hypothetical protein
MKRFLPTPDSGIAALMVQALPALQGVPVRTDAPMRTPLRPLAQAVQRTHKHRRASSRTAARARVKVWVLFPDGGRFDAYQPKGSSAQAAEAYWRSRLAPGGAWHTKGFVTARIYTAPAPGQFGSATFETIYP